MRRPVPKRSPYTLKARLSDLLLGISGLMLFGALALLVLAWLASDAAGIAAVTLPMRDS